MTMGMGMAGGGGFTDPVMTTALTTPANSQSSVIFNADGTEVVGAELQTNPGLTGTTGTTGGGGTFPTPVVATGWYVQAASGTTATATKDSSDDQTLSSAVGTSYLLDNANTVSFVAGQFYKGEVLVDKVVGTCQITVIKNDGTNVQAAAFTATMGVNRFWFKAASTAVGTIRINVPASGSITIRTASIKQVTSPLNCLRASINTGSGTASLIQRVAGVETVLISAATTVPAMNKNYAPTGCCTDPLWDLDVTTGWVPKNAQTLLDSVIGGRTGNCLSITEAGTVTPYATSATIAVKPGETWSFSSYAKRGTQSSYKHWVWSAQVGDVYNGTAQTAPVDWGSMYTTTFTVPAGCTSLICVVFMNSASGSGENIFFDDVTFTKTSTDDLTIVVDKAADGASSVVSMYHDGAQVGTSQTIDNTGGKDVILAGKNHYLSGDYGSSLLKKRRFGLGSELVVNGGFDADTAWTKGVGWSIADGKATSDNSQVAISQLLTTSETTLPAGYQGKVFRGVFTVSDFSGVYVRMNIGGYGPGVSVTSNKTQIDYMMSIVRPIPNRQVIIQANADFAGSVDNVSCKEVLLP